MEVRQISNRKNKICLCVGIGKCIISVIEMLLIKFYFKSKWPGQNVDLFFLWLGIIGILMILIAGVNIVSNIEINIVRGKNISRKRLRRLLIMKMHIVLWLEDLEIKKVIKN